MKGLSLWRSNWEPGPDQDGSIGGQSEWVMVGSNSTPHRTDSAYSLAPTGRLYPVSLL